MGAVGAAERFPETENVPLLWTALPMSCSYPEVSLTCAGESHAGCDAQNQRLGAGKMKRVLIVVGCIATALMVLQCCSVAFAQADKADLGGNKGLQTIPTFDLIVSG
jgi:hypothetical protein